MIFSAPFIITLHRNQHQRSAVEARTTLTRDTSITRRLHVIVASASFQTLPVVGVARQRTETRKSKADSA